ncbi:Uma2 family endonuclease [Candidatus Chloroploca sp. M-50]|uniref:Uma2 family endonuclease n=1 Tax=Candidatus Chloroploca mongolica TaxID=2528176 RepID=A0ABS4D9J4_9CHLR|nr:Uma2 family endonuclease [Candidatus Chloroploca mongolica]MBP1466116.1 Uma2 family endonuclease [Candidatus Chloroploca mongolica]
MSTEFETPVASSLIYPDSDGQPLSDNTLQFEWIMRLKGNFDALFADRPDVFVAGDLLWYPVEGRPDIRRAPDALVVFGRPKGYRGSYMQWREDQIAPQVVFEVLSPKNTLSEMARKLEFYDLYGVEEYYLYDPERNHLSGWLRQGERLHQLGTVDGWLSPRLGVRFALDPQELQIIRPDGRPFLSFVEVYQRADEAQQRADEAQQRADEAQQRADEAQQRAMLLTERLRALGLDPDAG